MQLEAEKKGLKVSALELSEHEDGYQIDRQTGKNLGGIRAKC